MINHLAKSLVHAAMVLIGGVAVWAAFVSMAAQRDVAMTPVAMVLLMLLYIIAYSVVAFFVHHKTVAGIPFEDSESHRRPSLVIPTVTTIALMVFVVANAGSHPSVWTLV